jgi:hypothetical protein
MSVNGLFDRLPRTRFGRATREVPAFRACGVTGFYVAVVLTLGGGLLAGLSLLVLCVVCAACGLSFFVYAYVRRWMGGAENLVLLEHVWFAEACAAGVLWALGEPVLAYLDPVAVGLCFFLAAGRIGCLLVGCCHGRPSSVGIRYGEEAARDGFPRHLVGVRLFPVPAVEAAALVAIGTTGLLALHWSAPGTVFTWFLVSYSVVRFGLEGLRGDARPHLLGLSVNRWMCVAELSFGVALWTHEHGGFGTEEIAMACGLLALLVAALAARAVLDPRGELLGEEHVAELRGLADAEPGAPSAQTTSHGVVVASTPAPDGMPLSHVSLSLASGTHDVELLCDLAARALPGAVIESAVLSDGTVLHVLAADVPTIGTGPDRLASALLAEVARRRQAEADAPELEQPVREPARAAYFGG